MKVGINTKFWERDGLEFKRSVEKLIIVFSIVNLMHVIGSFVYKSFIAFAGSVLFQVILFVMLQSFIKYEKSLR